MQKTNNLRVKEISPIITPEVLKQVFPLSDAGSEFITQSRKAISDIVKRQDKRLIAVVGPCSIHDQKAGLEYAERLSVLAKELEEWREAALVSAGVAWLSSVWPGSVGTRCAPAQNSPSSPHM